jgi:hypothetical protein
MCFAREFKDSEAGWSYDLHLLPIQITIHSLLSKVKDMDTIDISMEFIYEQKIYSASHLRVAPENVGLQK